MEKKIPSGKTEEENKSLYVKQQEYYLKYQNGLIQLKDIPIEMYNKKLLTLVATRNPQEFIDIVFKLEKAKIINVNLAGYVNIFPKDYKTQEVYDMIFSIKPEQYYKLIPKKFKTAEMAKELMKLNPANIKIIIPDHRTLQFYQEAFEYVDKSWFIRVIPDKLKTKKICNIAFEENYANFEYIPDEFKDQNMCLKAVEYDCMLYKLVPSKYVNKEICEATIYYGKGSKLLIFELIPDEYKTAKMCEIVLNESMSIFPQIPDIFKDQNMCLKAVKYSSKFYKLVPQGLINKEICEAAMYNVYGNKSEIFKLIPNEYKTQKMCEIAFEENIDNFKYIPNEYKNEQMCIITLRKKFIEYAPYVPRNLINQEITKLTLIELKHLLSIKKTIKLEGELLEEIIRLYPNLLKAFDRHSVEKIILRQLYLILETSTSIEEIQKKHFISKEHMERILEKMKKLDPKSYEKIQERTNNQKKEKIDTLIKDVSNLEKIIELLGEIKNETLTNEQKIKFAYLSGKYIINSFEDIYNFDYSLYNKNLHNTVKLFLQRILKIEIITKGRLHLYSEKTLEKETVEENNSWIENYNRDKFFGIKEGIQTIKIRYGKNAELLTLNIEQVIIELLKAENIPLKEVLVKNAFREYFKDTLFEYIYLLKDYDQEFIEKRKKK